MATYDDFAKKASTGSAECTLPITDFPELYTSLIDSLKATGLDAAAIVELINKKLLGFCPKCATCSSGQGLGLIATMKQMGSAAITFGGGSTQTKRMFEGMCLNPTCDCREITIFFRPDEDVAMADRLEQRGVRIARSHASGTSSQSTQGTGCVLMLAFLALASFCGTTLCFLVVFP